MHKSVMPLEALGFLNCYPGAVIVDATVGYGGHSSDILKVISPGGRLIGIDADRESLETARARLSGFGKTYELFNDNFVNFDKILKNLAISKVDGMLFDLGISSFQLEKSQRGFSFKDSGFLDMRMNKETGIPLWQALKEMTEEEIGAIIREMGEERYWRRIARSIVEQKRIEPIKDPRLLADTIRQSVSYKPGSKIDPATRTFQAFRIFINDELGALKSALLKVPDFLKPKGSVVVISFHSLEDRIVKHMFKDFEKQGILKVLTKKPARPSEKEKSENPRSRSAKLRSAERI